MLRCILLPVSLMLLFPSAAASQCLQSFLKKGLRGYKLGDEVVVKPTYCKAEDYFCATGIVSRCSDPERASQDEKFGLINTDGQEVVPCEYEGIARCSDTWGKGFRNYVLAMKDGRLGFLDRQTGAVRIPLIYDQFDFFGRFDASSSSWNWGPRSGPDSDYDPCSCFREGYAIASRTADGTRMEVLLDPEGREISAPGAEAYYALTESHPGRHLFRVRMRDGGYRFLNASSGALFPEGYRFLYHEERSEKWVAMGSGKHATRSLAGVVLAVDSAGRMGECDLNGQWRVQPVYDSLVHRFAGYREVLEARRNGTWMQLHPKTGGLLLDPVYYPEATHLIEGVFSYRRGEKYGLVHADGRELTGPVYDRAEALFPGVRVTRGRWQGVLDTLGKEILPVMYDAVADQLFGAYVVLLGGKYGYVGPGGAVIAPIDFDHYLPGQNGLSRNGWSGSAMVKMKEGPRTEFLNNLDDPCHCPAGACVSCATCDGSGVTVKSTDIYCTSCRGHGYYFHDGVRKLCDICLGQSGVTSASRCGDCNGCGRRRR
jgi:hypothetical protein